MCYILIILISILYSCSTQEIQDISKSAQIWTGGDITPPVLTSVYPISNTKIILTFNEALYKEAKNTYIHNSISIKESIVKDNILTIILNTPTHAGVLYSLSTKVKDIIGNSLHIVENIYGYNNNIPHLLISEFTTEGSKNNPDKTELIVLSEGNLAGVTLREGGISSFTQQVIFPNIIVQNGDFIIIHWNPITEPLPKTETKNKKQSAHTMSYNNAWDIFSSNGRGISNTNSVLVLLQSPHGKVLDSVIYSTKTDISNKYNGFNNKKVFFWTKEILQHNEWKPSPSHATIFPSDTVNPKNSSTTRSISRNSSYTDTNSKSDWHITPSRGSTFASKNTNTVYKK